MSDPADLTHVLFNGEVQLLDWSETRRGGAKIVLQLASPDDLEVFKTMTVKKGQQAGQRLAVAMVEVADDESAVPQVPITSRLSYQAAMLCKNRDFQRYAAELCGAAKPFDEARTAQWLRAACGIASRAELDTNPIACNTYHRTLGVFRAWLADTHPL